MAVQKNKVTRARRGQRRSHDALSKPSLSIDKTTGETHRRHHVTADGYMVTAVWVDESAATTPIDVDVVVLADSKFSLVELIEDEIMLSLPSQVCEDPACCRRPELDYGGDDVELEMQRQPNAFAELEKIK